MPGWKIVYRILPRIALPIFLATGTIATSGCSDPIAAANAKGALAQSQLDAGQIAEARKTIAEAVAARDDIPELFLLRGRIELRAKSPSAAYGAYSSALALDSANMEALIGVAQLGLQLGHIDESEDATNRILDLDPRQPNALMLKGLHEIIKRRYPTAVANADAILAISPGNEEATILKSRALALMGKPDEAFAAMEQVRKTAGDTASAAMTLLELYRLRGDGAAMVPLLERIRQLLPDEVERDVDEADTLYKLGDGARALAILRQRMLDPRLDEKSAVAIAAVWKEYEPEPLDAPKLAEFGKKAGLPAIKVMARFYLEKDDPARALAVLSNAPYTDDVAALRSRADVARGQLDGSFAQAQRILAKDATHCDALIVKAEVSLAKRRPDDAVSAATLAAASCPQMPAAFVTLARADEADGNKTGAAIAFRDAFDRNSQDSALVRLYTAWLLQHGESTRAVSIARRLTNNTPSLISAWQLWGELCARFPSENCSKDADAGLAAARKRFGVDRRSDELPSNGLFGRLTR